MLAPDRAPLGAPLARPCLDQRGPSSSRPRETHPGKERLSRLVEAKALTTPSRPVPSRHAPLCAQSNLGAVEAARLWSQVTAVAAEYGLALVSPAVNFCSGSCVEEVRPIGAGDRLRSRSTGVCLAPLLMSDCRARRPWISVGAGISNPGVGREGGGDSAVMAPDGAAKRPVMKLRRARGRGGGKESRRSFVCPLPLLDGLAVAMGWAGCTFERALRKGVRWGHVPRAVVSCTVRERVEWLGSPGGARQRELDAWRR